jgi:FixJ family two-component response regulator
MAEKKKILVLDDDQEWLDNVESILAPAYDLTLFKEPALAEEAVAAHDYALVIIDMRLPGVTGMEVLRRMAQSVPDLRAIMLTGHADVDSAVESMKTGALDYISKGTENLTGILRARVEEALGRMASRREPEAEGVAALIAKGESAELEFKSSARWDMHTNRPNKDLEKVIVKTVAGFLNSERGGMLLIGVDDDGAVVGLRHDYGTLGKRPNRDGYENMLISVLLDAYGKDCSPLIQITFHTVSEEDVCQISVKPSPRPAFVKDEKGEHLYIRAGNSTRLLSTREAIEYCKIRWK